MSADNKMIGDCLNREIFSSGKPLSGDTMRLLSHTGGGVKVNNALNDRLFKLIEYDNGVPYFLLFGKTPGEGKFEILGENIKDLTGFNSKDFNERLFLGFIEEQVLSLNGLPTDRSVLQQEILNGKISGFKIDMKFRMAGGEYKWLRDTCIAVKDEVTNKTSGVVGILHDISEQRKYTALLEEMKEKESLTDNLKITFLRNISHEVRTPLNAIVGFSTLLCEPESGYLKKKEYVNLINNSTDHFLEVMDNIMEISKIEADNSPVILGEVSIEDVVERVFRTFIQRAEKSIQLVYCTPEKIPDTIKTDSYKLYQILYNLVGNALKFTISGKVEFGFQNTDKEVEFFVNDTGIGIPDIHKPYIFNKFFQADAGSTRRFQGVGLGLSIAKAYIEMLGGTISFESREGEGSAFRFTLPF